MSRRRSHFVKRAINAITDFEFIFERFEMNVAGPVLDRLIQNQIDKANDRGSAGFCFCSSCTIAFPQLHQLAHFRSEEHTSELQSRRDLVCRLLLEKKKK